MKPVFKALLISLIIVLSVLSYFCCRFVVDYFYFKEFPKIRGKIIDTETKLPLEAAINVQTVLNTSKRLELVVYSKKDGSFEIPAITKKDILGIDNYIRVGKDGKTYKECPVNVYIEKITVVEKLSVQSITINAKGYKKGYLVRRKICDPKSQKELEIDKESLNLIYDKLLSSGTFIELFPE